MSLDVDPSEVTYRTAGNDPLPLASWQQAADLISTRTPVEFAAAGDDPLLRRLAWVLGSGEQVFVSFSTSREGIPNLTDDTHGDGTIRGVFAAVVAYLVPLDCLDGLPDMRSVPLATAASDEPPSVPSTGTVSVYTASGTMYRIDLDAMFLIREPGVIPAGDPTMPPASHPRGDTQRIKILAIQQLQVGKPAVFRLELLGDPRKVAFTTRITTDVVMLVPSDRPPTGETLQKRRQ
jgi:hypothetical protein